MTGMQLIYVMKSPSTNTLSKAIVLITVDYNVCNLESQNHDQSNLQSQITTQGMVACFGSGSETSSLVSGFVRLVLSSSGAQIAFHQLPKQKHQHLHCTRTSLSNYILTGLHVDISDRGSACLKMLWKIMGGSGFLHMHCKADLHRCRAFLCDFYQAGTSLNQLPGLNCSASMSTQQTTLSSFLPSPTQDFCVRWTRCLQETRQTAAIH